MEAGREGINYAWKGRHLDQLCMERSSFGSAMHGNATHEHEGLHLDQVIHSNVHQMAQIIMEQSRKGMSLKESILQAVRNLKLETKQSSLAQGKE